jgi:hypothetical protein
MRDLSWFEIFGQRANGLSRGSTRNVTSALRFMTSPA